MSIRDKTLVLPHDPLTPLGATTAPTAWTVRELRQELYANAQTVESSLGGGQHGHLGMLMPAAEYILVAHNATPYVLPEPPAAPIYNGTATHRQQQKEDFNSACKIYYEARDLLIKLRQLMLQAIPNKYIARLRHPTCRYANVHPRTILQHLLDNYGKIKPRDLTANRERLKTPWKPDEAIELVFTNGEECREFATEGGDPISDTYYLEALVTIFRQSGVMDDAVKDWVLKPADQKTIDNAIEHFTTRNDYHQETKAFLKGTMTANQAVEEAKIGTWKKDSSLMGYYYCWTHGIATHPGTECKYPAVGHIPTATLKQVQGGSLHVYQPTMRGAGRGNPRGRGGAGRAQNRTNTGKRKAEGEQKEN
jgi:hypothetical protein